MAAASSLPHQIADELKAHRTIGEWVRLEVGR
jgi:hypothetical protein